MSNDESTCEDCSAKGLKPESCYSAGRHSLEHRAARQRAFHSSRVGA